MQGPYGEYLLDADDVCKNCFRLVQLDRPRTQTSTGRSDVSVELTAATRHPTETTIEYAPHRIPPRSKGAFCSCGAESTYERLWNPETVSRDRFRDLVKAAIETLEAKEVTLRRKEAAMYCLHHFDENDDADRALANGLDAGIVAAAAAEDSADDQLRADGGR